MVSPTEPQKIHVDIDKLENITNGYSQNKNKNLIDASLITMLRRVSKDYNELTCSSADKSKLKTLCETIKANSGSGVVLKKANELYQKVVGKPLR